MPAREDRPLFRRGRRQAGIEPNPLIKRSYTLHWHWRREGPRAMQTYMVDACTVDDATAALRRQLKRTYPDVDRELAVIAATPVRS